MHDRPVESPYAEVRIPDALLSDLELRGTIAIQIYRELVSNPKSTIRMIARVLDCSERTVTRNLARLEEKGWLERLDREKGRPNSYSFPRLVSLAS